ncbi:hypothetical protein CDD83_9510 [Cordyceps sp. RAO-2017]|nr:hypothetical protein CDD83_9510 [Cordyceps sp. RAO-2017]
MIGTSLGEWILIRLSILFFRFTPLLYSILLLFVRLVPGPGQSAWRGAATHGLGALLLAEALFYAAIYLPYSRRLRATASHPPPLSPAARKALFHRCMAHVSDFECYLRRWFMGASVDDICRDNVRDFFLWAFFDMAEADAVASPHHAAIAAELDEYVAFTERCLKRPLGPGRGAAQCLRLTLDRVETTYRSLAWYLVVLTLDHATHLAMLWYGFHYYARAPTGALMTFPPRPFELFARRRSSAPGLGYWHRPHRPDRDHLPVLFFHGIGIGLWTYVRFVADLRRADRRARGVIVPELLPISFRLTAPPPDRLEFLLQMASILDQHAGWDRFTIVSHSYGSVLTTHMLTSSTLGGRVASVVLVDPVSIMLHLPDVAYNFTRRRPTEANEWQLWYFASTDPGVAHCLGRHFFWRENILWKEDLLSTGGGHPYPRKVMVCLAGRDLIVHVAAVAQYLGGESMTGSAGLGPVVARGGSARDQDQGRVGVVVFPNLDHAQIFDSAPDRQRLADMVSLCCGG